MLLSIVIPCLNEVDTIEQCLQRLSSCRSQQVELIVVDGGSADGSGERARPYCDKLVQTDRGRAKQMNCGAKIARGEWLLFLHVDTTLPEDFCRWLQVLSQQRPLWGFFAVRFSDATPLLRCVARLMNWRSRLTAVATGDQCQFVQRAWFCEIGGFADIPLMEDVELSKRLRHRVAPTVWLSPVTTSSRRWKKYGVVTTIVAMWWYRLAYVLGASPQRLARWYYGESGPDAG